MAATFALTACRTGRSSADDVTHAILAETERTTPELTSTGTTNKQTFPLTAAYRETFMVRAISGSGYVSPINPDDATPLDRLVLNRSRPIAEGETVIYSMPRGWQVAVLAAE